MGTLLTSRNRPFGLFAFILNMAFASQVSGYTAMLCQTETKLHTPAFGKLFQKTSGNKGKMRPRVTGEFVHEESQEDESLGMEG